MASQQSNITSTSTPTSTPEQMPPPRCSTAIGKTTSNANPTVSTPAPVLTDAVQRCVDTAAEAIATSQRSKIDLYARTSEKNSERSIQGTYKSPFSWDTINTECLCWNSFNQ